MDSKHTTVGSNKFPLLQRKDHVDIRGNLMQTSAKYSAAEYKSSRTFGTIKGKQKRITLVRIVMEHVTLE